MDHDPIDILVVEDENKFALALKQGLEGERYKVTVAVSGEEAFFQATTANFDIILLDWILPGRDGIEILGAIRNRGLRTPVLLLTARDGLEDRVHGLNSGADDYLVKPFAFAELLARIRALLRRTRSTVALHLLIGDLELDLVPRRARRNGKVLHLTMREYELLEYLARHKNQLVTRDSMSRDIWKERTRDTLLNNVIDVHIARLRKKVDLGQRMAMIHTIRGLGFMLRDGES